MDVIVFHCCSQVKRKKSKQPLSFLHTASWKTYEQQQQDYLKTHMGFLCVFTTANSSVTISLKKGRVCMEKQ